MEFCGAKWELLSAKSNSIAILCAVFIRALDDFINHFGDPEHKRFMQQPSCLVCEAPRPRVAVNFDRHHAVCHLMFMVLMYCTTPSGLLGAAFRVLAILEKDD